MLLLLYISRLAVVAVACSVLLLYILFLAISAVACNVLMSVTGTYSEQPHPVYYCPAARSSWIQGVLERPTYKIPAGTNLPIVEAVDLANLDQQAPGGSTSTTVQGSISYVGPANADPDGAGA